MAEYEGKADSEICVTCKFFEPIVGVNYRTGEKAKTLHGWCKKHWRMNQKEDTRTHATNWCQFYEANMDKKKLLEDAVQMITPDPNAPITLTSEEQVTPSDEALDAAFEDRGGRVPYEDSEEVASDAYPHDWINDPTVAAHVVNENIRNELATMLKELAQFRTNTERQLIAVTLNGDNLAIMETKGMMRVAAIFYSQIEARMAQLTEAARSYGAATSRPHRGDVN